MNSEQLDTILDRFVKCSQTDADIVSLRQVLSNILSGIASESPQIVLQLSKYSINVDKAKGLQIGDHTFQEVNDEAMKQ